MDWDWIPRHTSKSSEAVRAEMISRPVLERERDEGADGVSLLVGCIGGEGPILRTKICNSNFLQFSQERTGILFC